ncbi:hypothetical protein [Ferrimonas balearica]|uniref:hypothetical protein n=1 Tax=Ferrimonas balearica TaxID=44012 RepID=UPI001C97A75B|nr:hypothetical protein [Ferrimonas balearica]MBY5981269.1 hypothetical protein [Ferrimonas balearica]MBY6018654.1 hypothetical protein [Halomonas denitrificans]
MKKTALLTALFVTTVPFGTSANEVIDLTLSENIDIAQMYPEFSKVRVLNFADNIGNDSLRNGTYFALEREDGSMEIFSARISLSKASKQMLYIEVAKECSNSNEEGTPAVLKVNEQNVSFTRFCSGENYYYAPKTTAGSNFLVEQFRKSDTVAVNAYGFRMFFDATGFIASWDSFGGDAL